ncbi:MAG: hypothetical protein ACK5WZ_06705 [Pseudobdellovibrionaceae bacterium]
MILINETPQRHNHTQMTSLQPELQQRRKRVLIVEDDISYRPMWEHVIYQTDPSIRVDWAQSEEQAEKLINQRMRNKHPYDLIIADFFLAGIKTGVDLWEKYGDWSSHFIFVSGLPREKFDDLMSQDYGAPIYLQKPLRPKFCRELVAELLNENLTE